MTRRHLYYYTHLDQPFAHVAAVLSDDPGRWLPPPAAPDDDEWLVELCADGALPRALASHRALVRIGDPSAGSVGVLRAVTWRSAAADRLVPVLEGDLELVPLTGHGCQFSLMGTYRPPLAVVGDAGDRLLGHRVAEACVRRFVLDVADRLTVSALPA